MADQPISWWLRFRQEAYEFRKKRRDDKAARERAKKNEKKHEQKRGKDERRTKRQRFREGMRNHGSLAAAIALIVFSTAVAIPAQVAWFGEFMSMARSMAAAGMIEGAAWFAAILYADSLRRQRPSRIARLATLVLALVAATINFQHGVETNFTTGVVYALSSLLGVGTWEMYMHSRRQIAAGLSPEERRVWLRRRFRYWKVMREMADIRATFGLAVTREQAWQWAYLRKEGQPTVPVATSDPIIQQLLAGGQPAQAPTPAPVPGGTERDNGGTDAGLDHEHDADPVETTPGGVAVEEPPEVMELAVDWSKVRDIGDLFNTLPEESRSTGTDAERDRDNPSGTERDEPGTTAGTDRDNHGRDHRDNAAGQAVTSDVPPAEESTGTNRDSTSGRQSRSESRSKSRPDEASAPVESRGGTTGGEDTGTSLRDDTGTYNKKQLLIYRYWQLRDEDADPLETNFTAEGRAFGADRKYVKRIFEECAAGKHPAPDERLDRKEP